VLASLGWTFYVGWSLTHLPRAKMPTSPVYWGLPYRSIRFPSAVDHLQIRGWWIPAPRATLTVIFSHGFGSNRADIGVPGLLMMRAVHLWGANVLTFDYRAEGRSPGALVSVGEFEVRDLQGAATAAMRLAPHVPVAVVGYSMGAAIALMGAERDPKIAAVVADSPFAALVPYLEHTLPIWPGLPSWPFNWLMLDVAAPLLGISPGTVSPLAHVAAIGRRPVLLIAGKADKTIPYRNSVELYTALRRSDPAARLWLVPGAHHVESFQLRPLAYLARLWGTLHEVDPRLRRLPAYGL
jgi:alpha-beta hydrolase superfamily lysophospholipase